MQLLLSCMERVKSSNISRDKRAEQSKIIIWSYDMQRFLVVGLISVFLTACVSNTAVKTIQPTDYDLGCDALKYELAELGVKFEEAKDDSGFTGKNVGMAILFWPGIFVNESRAGKNQSSIDNRITHLSGLYNTKCRN